MKSIHIQIPAVLALGLTLFAAPTVHAYYNAGTGRWLSRDPIAEDGGRNLYGPCGNDPVSTFDVLGLWSSMWVPRIVANQHEDLTLKSVNSALYGLLLPEPSKRCIARIQHTLLDANVGQDNAAGASDLNRHFNRKFVFREMDDDKQDSRVEAREGYLRYLALEEDNFKKPIRNPKKDCWERMQSLGRLSHSWQDYFAHGVDAKQGFLDPIAGSPEDPEFWPSSYNSPTGIVSGEHPNLAEPVSGSSQRYQQALSYVSKRFREALVGWMLSCGCICDK